MSVKQKKVYECTCTKCGKQETFTEPPLMVGKFGGTPDYLCKECLYKYISEYIDHKEDVKKDTPNNNKNMEFELELVDGIINTFNVVEFDFIPDHCKSQIKNIKKMSESILESIQFIYNFYNNFLISINEKHEQFVNLLKVDNLSDISAKVIKLDVGNTADFIIPIIPDPSSSDNNNKPRDIKLSIKRIR